MNDNILRNAGLVLALALGGTAAHAETDVQKLADLWAAAYNAHNKEALGAVYAEDARLMMHGLPSYLGREDIAAFWAEDFKVDNPRTVLKVTHSVEGIDMVLVHGDYQVVDDDDHSKILGQGRFAHIWVADGNGGWVLDRDLWNQPYE